MRIKLIAVGTKMPTWVNDGYYEYAKRLSTGDWQLELVEIPAIKRGKSADIARIKQKEGEALLAATRPQDHIIALDVKGRAISTESLSECCADWQRDGQSIALLVGGPDGLSKACLQTANQLWSLSPLTLPHPLVRVIVAEQFYRARSILQNHPYHR